VEEDSGPPATTFGNSELRKQRQELPNRRQTARWSTLQLVGDFSLSAMTNDTAMPSCF